jgi:hypothetical protein
MIKLGRRLVLRSSLGLAAVGLLARPHIAVAQSSLPEEESPNHVIYEGALSGSGTGNAVNGLNVPFVNGTARIDIDLSKSTVVGRFRADVFVAEFNRFMEGWLDVEGKGTFSSATGTYSFSSYTGQFNAEAIGSKAEGGDPLFTVVLGGGSTTGSSDQLTVGTLQGHDHDAASIDTFTASYALISRRTV